MYWRINLLRGKAMAFIMLSVIYVVTLLLAALAIRPGKSKTIAFVVLLSPAAYFSYEYTSIRIRHELMCANHAGLKIERYPTPTDKVRMKGEFKAYTPNGLFIHFFPRLTLVEAKTKQRGSNGALLDRYEEYVATANPRAGAPMAQFPWKEPAFNVDVRPIEKISDEYYEIQEIHSSVPDGEIWETTLTRKGVSYATYREIRHWWSRVKFADGVPDWRCPDPNSLNTPAPIPTVALTALLLGR